MSQGESVVVGVDIMVAEAVKTGIEVVVVGPSSVLGMDRAVHKPRPCVEP